MTSAGRDEVPELKPCPFCGSAARWAACEGGDDSWEIQCSNNDCCIVLFAGATAGETVASWNARADKALTRENRELREALEWALPFALKAPDPTRSEDDVPSGEWLNKKKQARAALAKKEAV